MTLSVSIQQYLAERNTYRYDLIILCCNLRTCAQITGLVRIHIAGTFQTETTLAFVINILISNYLTECSTQHTNNNLTLIITPTVLRANIMTKMHIYCHAIPYNQIQANPNYTIVNFQFQSNDPIAVALQQRYC